MGLDQNIKNKKYFNSVFYNAYGCIILGAIRSSMRPRNVDIWLLWFFFFYFTTTNNVFEFFRSNTVPLFYCSSGMFEILQIIFLVAFYNHHKSVVIVHNSSTKLCIYKDCDSTHSPLFYLLSIPWSNQFIMNHDLNEKVGICSIHVKHMFS